MALEPSYRDAQSLLERATAEQERQEQLVRLRAEAEQAVSEGQWEQAIGCLEKSLSLAPKQPEVRELLDRARQEQQTDERAQALFGQARAHAKQEEWEPALRAAEQALALRPDTPACLAFLAQAKIGLGRARQYASAQAALDRREWAAAIEALQEIIEEAPGYRNSEQLLKQAEQGQAREGPLAALYEAGAAAVQERRWADAVAALQDLLEKDAGFSDAAALLKTARNEVARAQRLATLYESAQAALDRSEWAAAIEALQEISKQAPDYRNSEQLLKRAEQGQACEAPLAALYEAGAAAVQERRWADGVLRPRQGSRGRYVVRWWSSRP